jgi:hypothetical protein
MGCSNCKKKNNFVQKIQDDIENGASSTPKKVIWFVAIWFILGIYGLYTLIHDLYNLITHLL